MNFWISSVCLLVAASANFAVAETAAGHMGQMGAHMHDGPHMTFTDERARTEDDVQRARELLSTLRETLAPYHDADAAIGDGYRPFLPTVPQEVYHFVHYGHTAQEYTRGFDPRKPGSLLYVKSGPGDYRLVGVMYSAPAHATRAELDRRIPLSVGRWHAHVNVCLPEGIGLEDLTRGEIGAGNTHLAGTLPVDGPDAELARRANERYGFMADGRFGFEGKIADRASCEAAGGRFLSQAWGWMIHVYPFTGDDLTVAYGMDVPAAR